MATKKPGSSKKSGSSKKGATKKAAAREPSAAKLQGLQKRLNDDTRLRNNFLKNPGAVLRREGVELGSAKEEQLAKFTREMTAPQREFFGAELARIRIGISVRIRIRIRIGIVL